MAIKDLSDEDLTFLYWYQDAFIKDLDQRYSELVKSYGYSNNGGGAVIEGVPYRFEPGLNDAMTLFANKVAKIERDLPGFITGSRTAAPADEVLNAYGETLWVTTFLETWADLVLAKEIAARDLKIPKNGITRFGDKVAKTKRGLQGFINGSRTAALADTGAAQNIISADFAHKNGLLLEGKTAVFRLGNSKSVRSAGTVKVRWAFVEKPTELYEIVCHVIQHCTFDVILGSNFLTATETFSKHLHRLVKCVFNVFNVFNLTLMDGGRQTLDGQVGDWLVHAIADTGAERNVMDSIYAEALGFKISKRSNDRGFLQFADGTFQETVGQVDTTWTFASGLEIPITFEVLENCSADVVLGEDFLLDHDVFGTHAPSMQEMPYEDEEDEPADLSQFGYTNYLQQKFENGKTKIMSKFNRRTHREEISEDETLQQHETEERHRRDQWTYQYGFEGFKASPAEKQAEDQRKKSYNARHARLEALRRHPHDPRRDAPLISSTPSAPETTMSRQPTRAPPVIPSIPTAPSETIVPPVPPSATNTRGTAPATPTSMAAAHPDNAPSNAATIDQIRRGRRFR